MKPPPPVSTTSSDKTTIGVVLLSLFGYPGGGHFVLKEPLRGFFFGGGFTLALMGALTAFALIVKRIYETVTELGEPDFSPHGMYPFLGLCCVCVVIWVWAAVDVAILSRRAKPSEELGPPAEEI